MAEKTLTVSNFYGGISQGDKVGLKGAFGADSEFLDFNQDPNQITVLPQGTKISDNIVTGLVKWIVDGSPHDANRYAYDENGCIYQETRGGVWTKIRTVSGSRGQGLAVINNYLYYVQNTQIGRYGPLSTGSPSFTDNWQTGLNDTSASGFAPILQFAGGFAVGHGKNLAWWDGTIWDPDKLTMPDGFNIRTLTQVQEFVVGGMWQSAGPTVTGNVLEEDGGNFLLEDNSGVLLKEAELDNSLTNSPRGYVFFWDGASDSATYFFPTDGPVNAIGNTRNRLIGFFGTHGNLYTDQDPFNLVHRIPKLAFSNYIEIYPGAITTWKGQTYFGCSANTDSTDIKHGIYSFGAMSTQYPEVLNYAAKISTGTQDGMDMSIGCVQAIDDQLYWSWRDGTEYGIDKIVASSLPNTTGKYVSLVHDDEHPGHDKMTRVLEVTHRPLRDGESIQMGGRRDRTDDFTNNTPNTTVGSQKTRYALPKYRYKEFEFQVLLNCGDTAPTVTSINYVFDDLREESQMT